jgi:hypothetical protein
VGLVERIITISSTNRTTVRYVALLVLGAMHHITTPCAPAAPGSPCVHDSGKPAALCCVCCCGLWARINVGLKTHPLAQQDEQITALLLYAWVRLEQHSSKSSDYLPAQNILPCSALAGRQPMARVELGASTP